MILSSTILTLAQCVPSMAPGGQSQGGSPMLLVGYMFIIFALFYVMIIMPQKRKEKERKNLVESTKTGDRVIFCGGIIGTVTNVKDNTFIVKVADKTKIEILRGAVLKTLGKDEEIKEVEE